MQNSHHTGHTGVGNHPTDKFSDNELVEIFIHSFMFIRVFIHSFIHSGNMYPNAFWVEEEFKEV